jgi:hypothetical protein
VTGAASCKAVSAPRCHRGKHNVRRYRTCWQVPPSYWLAVLGVTMAVATGYTAQGLPVLRRGTRHGSKGPVCLI